MYVGTGVVNHSVSTTWTCSTSAVPTTYSAAPGGSTGTTLVSSTSGGVIKFTMNTSGTIIFSDGTNTYNMLQSKANSANLAWINIYDTLPTWLTGSTNTTVDPTLYISFVDKAIYLYPSRGLAVAQNYTDWIQGDSTSVLPTSVAGIPIFAVIIILIVLILVCILGGGFIWYEYKKTKG